VRLAAERHLRDLQRPDLVWDLARLHRYRKVCDGLEAVLSHSGEPFRLLGWQAFAFGSLLCWRWRDTLERRYKLGVVQVARKNGKSTGAATLCADDLLEGDGKRCIIVANTIAQGEAIYGALRQMMRRQDFVGLDAVKNTERFVGLPARDNRCYRVAAKENTLDGLNPSLWLGDEAACWRGRFVTKLLTSTQARADAYGLIVSTPSEEGEAGVWDDLMHQGLRVLRGDEVDDSRFFLPFGIDENDDPGNEAVWIKANPSLGHTINLETLRRQFASMSREPLTLQEWIRFHCARRANTAAVWLDLAQWDCGAGELPPIDGREVWGGLDLAKSGDMASLMLAYREGSRVCLWGRHWYPEGLLIEREQAIGLPLRKWVAQGLVIASPGRTIDLDLIRSEIAALRQRCNLVQLAFDRWGSRYFAEKLATEDGVPLIKHGQGLADMAPACAEFKRLFHGGQVWHGGNPVLHAALRHAKVWRDSLGNERPVKRSDRSLIDPLLAALMAVHCLTLSGVDASPYANSGYV